LEAERCLKVDRLLRGQCQTFAALPPNFSTELATGRVRPSADKGVLDPPALPGVSAADVILQMRNRGTLAGDDVFDQIAD